MKKNSQKITAGVLALCIVLGVLAALPVAAADTSGEIRYTRKIVSVVYDNSGSMVNADQRSSYAQYAAQTLISLLDARDTLYIVPMNYENKQNKGYRYEVDLKTDRSAAISRAISQTFFNPNSGTPSESVEVAVKQLVDAGLKKNEEILFGEEPDVEYWLIILTDGAFDGINSADHAVEKIEEYAKGYYGLRTVYLGFGEGSQDLSDSGLDDVMPFTSFRITDTKQIVSSMQQIACLLSGKFQLDKSAVSVNGSSVTVDLNQCDFPISSIATIAQNCGATLTSAMYNGKSTDISQMSVIEPSSALGMKNGYSATLKNLSDTYFYGGKLELKYSASISPDNISVLIEPALSITPYVEYQGKEIDSQYINSNLKPGDMISVGYRVYERKGHTTVDLKKAFGVVNENITYAGSSYQVNKPFALVEGKNDITVSVDVMNGVYKMYGSIFCNVEENPEYFKIIDDVKEAYDGDPNKTRIEYTVYIDNKMVPAEDLKANHYIWSVSARDESGNNHAVASGISNGKIYAVLDTGGNNTQCYYVTAVVETDSTVSARDAKMRTCETKIEHRQLEIFSEIKRNIDGSEWKNRIEYTIKEGGAIISGSALAKYKYSIVAQAPDGSSYPINTSFSGDKLCADIDMQNGKNGAYTVTLTISTSFGNVTDVQRFSRMASSMTLSVFKNDCSSMTQHAFDSNGKEIIFELLSEGQPLLIDSSMSYTVTLDGRDVSQYVTVKDNHLIYIPQSDHFGGTVSAGKKTVKVNISYIDKSSVSARAETEMNVSESLYSFAVIDTGNKDIELYPKSICDVSVAFKLLLDGEAVNYDEVKRLYENGEITVKDKGFLNMMFWLPYGKTVSVENDGGDGVIMCKVEREACGFLNFFLKTPISHGDKPITVNFRDVSATDKVHVVQYGFATYLLWHLLSTVTLLLILYVISWETAWLFVCLPELLGRTDDLMLPSGYVVEIGVVLNDRNKEYEIAQPRVYSENIENMRNIANENKKELCLRRLIPWPWGGGDQKHWICSPQVDERNKLILKKRRATSLMRLDQRLTNYVINDVGDYYITKLRDIANIAIRNESIDDFDANNMIIYFDNNKSSKPLSNTAEGDTTTCYAGYSKYCLGINSNLQVEKIYFFCRLF